MTPTTIILNQPIQPSDAPTLKVSFTVVPPPAEQSPAEIYDLRGVVGPLPPTAMAFLRTLMAFRGGWCPVGHLRSDLRDMAKRMAGSTPWVVIELRREGAVVRLTDAGWQLAR